jgi:phage terminase large subunit
LNRPVPSVGPVVTPPVIHLAAAKILLRRKRATDPSSPIKPFRGASLEAQTTTARSWVLEGPAETTKTWGGLSRLDADMRKYPGAKGAIVRKVRADMDGTVLDTYRQLLRLRGEVRILGGEHPEIFEYPNGSRVFIGGMDRPGKVLSGERDAIYCNQLEEFSLSDFGLLTTRCTGRGAVMPDPWLGGDCNPGPPTHWILGRPELTLLHSRHEDNPSLFLDDGTPTEQWTKRTLPTLDALPGVLRDRLRFGRWVSAEGAVYDGWDRAIHLIQRSALPQIQRWVCGVDFGYTNPFVWARFGIDDDGRIYLEREIYRTRRIVEDHAAQIRRLNEGYRIEATICDHDAEDRATLERHGISTTTAHKALEPGIQNIQSRLRKAGDGRPRLFVVEDALVDRDEALVAAHKPTCTAQEFEVYRYRTAVDGRPLKEEPVKEDDHGMDLLRYVAAYVDDIGKPPSQPFHFIPIGEPSPWAIPSYQRGRGWGDPPGGYGNDDDSNGDHRFKPWLS